MTSKDLNMLCLTHRENESINLHASGGLVEINISKIKGNQAILLAEA
jgi:sRNA-binding carbon storage regulator CsrA